MGRLPRGVNPYLITFVKEPLVNSTRVISASVTRTNPETPRSAPMLVLIAAFLGWMFDGLEMGIFPLVARPALPGDAAGIRGTR